MDMRTCNWESLYTSDKNGLWFPVPSFFSFSRIKALNSHKILFTYTTSVWTNYKRDLFSYLKKKSLLSTYYHY